MGITGITAFRNVARNLSQLVMLAIVSLFYTVQAQAGQATMAWDANIESIGGYRLYYGQTSRNYATNVDVGNKTISTVTGLEDGKTYYFAVQAYAIGGQISSRFSNEVSKTIGGGGGNAGLVGAYNFEEASGTTVVDASNQGNHGTLFGVTRSTNGRFGKARFGKALSFDGVDDRVTVKDAPSLDPMTGLTLEAWVYPGLANHDIILAKVYQDGSHNAPYFAYSLHVLDTGTPRFWINAGGSSASVTSPDVLAENVWTHIGGVYDGSTIKIYINGVQKGSVAKTGTILNTTGSVKIGAHGANGEPFQGKIDEVRIYNRALSATEIQTDVNRSVATSSPPVTLVGTKTIGPVADSNPQGKAEAFQRTAAVTGLMTSLSVYVDSGSTATMLVAGLYTHTNGHPGTLLAQGTLTSPTAGSWNTVALPAKSLRAGTKYWIAVLGPSGELTFRDAVGSTSHPSETSAQTTLTTLPSTWTTGSPSYQGPVSAYGAGHKARRRLSKNHGGRDRAW